MDLDFDWLIEQWREELKPLSKALGDSLNLPLAINIGLCDRLRFVCACFYRFPLEIHLNMSVTSYFTNLSKIPNRQKRFPCDLGEQISPEWSSSHLDASSSEDSNSSTNATNSSTSVRSGLSDVKPLALKVNNSSVSSQTFLLQTPDKTLKYCTKAEKRVTPRKPLKPTKSANKSDPSFRGVTLQMKTSVKRSRDDIETQLVIRSYFTAKKKRPSAEKTRCRRPAVNPRLVPSSLELRFQQSSTESGICDADELKENYSDLGCRPFRLAPVEKECASCGTLKTPLWRDAEDGTPLCNACGIRYKKYRIRCSRCWYIPKKEHKTSSHCSSCGTTIKVPLGRRGNIFADL